MASFNYRNNWLSPDSREHPLHLETAVINYRPLVELSDAEKIVSRTPELRRQHVAIMRYLGTISLPFAQKSANRLTIALSSSYERLDVSGAPVLRIGWPDENNGEYFRHYSLDDGTLRFGRRNLLREVLRGDYISGAQFEISAQSDIGELHISDVSANGTILLTPHRAEIRPYEPEL